MWYSTYHQNKETLQELALIQSNLNVNKCISIYDFFNVTNEMHLLKTLLLSLLYMFQALLAHHQELTKTVRAAYSDGMR